MRKFIGLFIAITAFLPAWGQDTRTGRVTYTHLMKIEIKLEGAAAQFADRIPRERSSEKILWYNNEATLFENGTSSDGDMAAQTDQGNVMIRMTQPDNKIFTRLSDGFQIEQREFMTRWFLIEDEPQRSWKLTGQQKMILGFPCQEAVMGEEDKKVTAWFTPVIPVSSGPAGYGGLPGLILSLEMNEGRQVYTVTKVEHDNPLAEAIRPPDKGRKVTREEYNTTVEEKLKEMGAQPEPGGQQTIIRIAR